MIGCGEKMLHDFGEHVCTGYNCFMRAHVLSYHDRLNAVMDDLQGAGIYYGGLRIHFGEDGYSLHVEDGAMLWSVRVASSAGGR